MSIETALAAQLDDMHRRVSVSVWPGAVAVRAGRTSPAQTRHDWLCCQFRVRAPGRPREREEVPMPIVGGLDIHREQITFDYLDTVTGEVKRGQIAPPDRAHLRGWRCRAPTNSPIFGSVEFG